MLLIIFLPEFKSFLKKLNALKISLFAQLCLSSNDYLYNTLEYSQEMEAE